MKYIGVDMTNNSQPIEVWIDLEATIITNWHDGLLILPQISNIRRWLNFRSVSEINIWSFAIWNDADKKEFVSSGMKDSIERILSRPIILYPSIEEMKHFVHAYESIQYDSRTEFIQLNGKLWSFVKFCLGNRTNKHMVLIDDAVPNMTIHKPDINLTIESIKVYDI